MSTKDEYVAKLKAQLDEWSTDIDELEVKAHLAKAELKDQYAEKISELKAKRVEAEGKLSELQDAAEEAWEELKKGGESIWETLKTTFSEAKSKFDK
jgi:chromosome segregation ATPase